MTGATLVLGVEGTLPVVGTTCTPSIVVGVESGPETAAAEEVTDPGVPVETGAEIAALEAAGGSAEADTELEPDAVASTAREVAAREPGDELAIIVVEEPFAVETTFSLAPAPVEVAKTELVVVFATSSNTSGSAATKTKATFCAFGLLLPDEFEGAARGVSAERTVELPDLVGAVLGVEVTLSASTSVAPAKDAF